MEDNEKLYPAVPAQVFKAALDDKESCKPTASLSHSLAFTLFLFQGGSKICQSNAWWKLIYPLDISICMFTLNVIAQENIYI